MDQQQTKTPKLSPHGVRICSRLAEGKSTAEIAEESGTSNVAIRMHIFRMVKDIGVPNRVALVAWFVRNQLSV